jgi:hypothetical protein
LKLVHAADTKLTVIDVCIYSSKVPFAQVKYQTCFQAGAISTFEKQAPQNHQTASSKPTRASAPASVFGVWFSSFGTSPEHGFWVAAASLGGRSKTEKPRLPLPRTFCVRPASLFRMFPPPFL